MRTELPQKSTYYFTGIRGEKKWFIINRPIRCIKLNNVLYLEQKQEVDRNHIGKSFAKFDWVLINKVKLSLKQTR